jgi:hypothetical protein
MDNVVVVHDQLLRATLFDAGQETASLPLRA